MVSSKVGCQPEKVCSACAAEGCHWQCVRPECREPSLGTREAANQSSPLGVACQRRVDSWGRAVVHVVQGFVVCVPRITHAPLATTVDSGLQFDRHGRRVSGSRIHRTTPLNYLFFLMSPIGEDCSVWVGQAAVSGTVLSIHSWRRSQGTYCRLVLRSQRGGTTRVKVPFGPSGTAHTLSS